MSHVQLFPNFGKVNICVLIFVIGVLMQISCSEKIFRDFSQEKNITPNEI